MKKFIFTVLIITFFLEFSFLPQFFSNYPGHLLLIGTLMFIFNLLPVWLSGAFFLGTGIVWDYFSFRSWGIFSFSIMFFWWMLVLMEDKIVFEKMNYLIKLLMLTFRVIVFEMFFYLLYFLKETFLEKNSSVELFSQFSFTYFIFLCGAVALFFLGDLLWVKAELTLGGKSQEIKIS